MVPFSYAIHRNATYQIPARHFFMGDDGIIGMMSHHAGNGVSNTLVIEQRFREEGAGLGSAQWDGSFVLAELLQRLDFSKAHKALDQAIQSNASSFRIPPWSQSKEARRMKRYRLQQQYRTRHDENSSCDSSDVSCEISSLFLPWTGKYTVELGTGLGLVSLVACLMGAKSVATDGDEAVLHHARKNFAKNLKKNYDDKTYFENSDVDSPSILDPWVSCRCCGNDGNVEEGMVTTTQLLWGDSHRVSKLLRDVGVYSDDKMGKHDQDLDFVLAADVVYGYDKDSGYDRYDTFKALVQSLVDLCSLSTLFILAYQRRRSTERIFFDKLSEHFEGIKLDQKLLHHDFVSSKMEVHVFRRRDFINEAK
eukprot:CAMPEP_0178904468 /NCGR_PEP_ID=MMETSP0786-20121207/5716_1 /TAXON_ID=186022 /ORGANISM="Thalassionema frauenfeldii, Strain CCMP 1798" /LENGTH=364 /DNA_ID=CAMNT_0020575927 /DNA_START=167 /DNA_END=1261 /DNA_ORIENTATION=-